MERPLLSGSGISPGDQNSCPAQNRRGKSGQDSHQLDVKDGSEQTLSLGVHLSTFAYPKILDENELVDTAELGGDKLGEVDAAPTIESQQNHALRESMIQQEENAEYTFRAPHLKHHNSRTPQPNGTTPRFRHQNQQY